MSQQVEVSNDKLALQSGAQERSAGQTDCEGVGGEQCLNHEMHGTVRF